METIAVYWEKRIKVYGITPKYGLALASLSFPRSQLEKVASAVRTLEEKIKRFELITFQDIDDSIELLLLLEQEFLQFLDGNFKEKMGLSQNDTLFVRTPVDLLYLHGPHFQDRFGILDTALDALGQNNIEVIGSGCAGTSMYLVVPDSIGPAGLRVLTDTFLIPTST